MIRTFWVWFVGTFLTVIFGTLLILFSFLDPSGKAMHICAQLWAKGILAASGVSVKVQGVENLLTDSPQILASNHQGFYDIFSLFAYIPIRFGWIAKKELYRIPVFGMSMRRFGNIMIDRSDREKARESLHIAADKIKNGNSVIIFPEGTRTRDGKVLPFKKGLYYIAEASGVPVVPISISGSFEIMQKNGFRIRPGTIHLVVGKPIQLDPSNLTNRSAYIHQLRETIMKNQVPVS